jgi:hypothetical protein
MRVNQERRHEGEKDQNPHHQACVPKESVEHAHLRRLGSAMLRRGQNGAIPIIRPSRVADNYSQRSKALELAGRAHLVDGLYTTATASSCPQPISSYQRPLGSHWQKWLVQPGSFEYTDASTWMK